MPWCWNPGSPIPPVWLPSGNCPNGMIAAPVQPGTGSGPGSNPINDAAAAATTAVAGAVSSGIEQGLKSEFGGSPNLQGIPKFFNWFSGPSGAEHWKGIGLLALAVVAGIVGLMLWTGKGETAVKVSTSTGQRMAEA